MADVDLPFIVVHADESCLGNGTTPPNPMIQSAITLPRTESSISCWSTVVSEVITAK